MNHPTSNLPASINEAEWQLQELARLGKPASDSTNDDLLAYRAIDRALRSPPDDTLPTDFAASVARIAQGQGFVRNDGFEQNLIRILVAVLGISGGVAIAMFSGELLQGTFASLVQLGDATLGWSSAALACLGLSWLCSQLLQGGRSPACYNRLGSWL